MIKQQSFLKHFLPLNCLNINSVTENYHKHNVKIVCLPQILIDLMRRKLHQHHSEKLAIAFGLLNTTSETTIPVVIN